MLSLEKKNSKILATYTEHLFLKNMIYHNQVVFILGMQG